MLDIENMLGILETNRHIYTHKDLHTRTPQRKMKKWTIPPFQKNSI